MRDRELKLIEYSMHMAYLWIVSLKHADAVYKDDLRKWKAAKKYIGKERAKIVKRNVDKFNSKFKD